MTLLLQYTLLYFSVLFIVALGGCISEHSGVINLGLEGTMVIGALGGALTMKFCAGLPAGLLVLLVIVVSMASGLLYSCLLSIAAIKFKADQTLIGIAMNLLATAAATVLVKSMNMAENASNPSSTIQFISQRKYLFFHIGSFEISVFLILAVALLIGGHLYLYKTRAGLRLRACGEHPQAADSVGIKVNKIRYIGVSLSGILGGLGGIAYITAGVSEWKFENGVAGFGFLALAVMIFGQWKPINIALAALLFGFLRALSNVYMGIPFLANINLPGTFYNMLPYIICLVVLIFASKRSAAPKAEGIPYDKGEKR